MPRENAQNTPDMDNNFAPLAWLFWVGAIVLTGCGVFRMYIYDSTGADKIVGGDAYNYTILATRGVGLIAAGGTSAITAVLFMLASISKAQWETLRFATQRDNGTHDARPASTITCARCGTAYDADASGCGHCGLAKPHVTA